MQEELKPITLSPAAIEIAPEPSKKINKKWLVILVGILVLIIGMATWGVKNRSTVILDPSGGMHMPTVTPTPTVQTIFTTALLGGGGAGHEGGELSDTILIARADTIKKELTLINIPRDLWVPITLKTTGKQENKKVNFAYWAGGPDELKRIVQMITGFEVNSYVWVDFSGFVSLIDNLGGVDVEVPSDFVDNLYPIAGNENETCGKTDEEVKAIVATMSGLLVDQQFPCRYEKVEFKKGPMHMDGATALKFVRSRHAAFGGGDFARAQRQQAMIVGIRKKVLSVGGITRLPGLVNMAKQYVKTDMQLEQMVTLAIKLPDIADYKIRRILLSTDTIFSEGQSEDRQYILFPKSGMGKWDEVKDYVQMELLKQN